jgi:HTH-type transcriptional regulator/antitoxin HigA
MPAITNKNFRGKIRDDYLKLILKFPLSSLKSESHFEAAQKIIDELLARPKLSYGEEMYLDVLSDLVAAYEDEHHSFGPASDADMLRHLMEAKNVSQADLHRDTGLAKSAISEVLSGKKPFSRQMVRKLADYFNVNIGILTANF